MQLKEFLFRHNSVARKLVYFLMVVSMIPAAIGGLRSVHWFRLTYSKADYVTATFVVERIEQVKRGKSSKTMAAGRIGGRPELLFDWKHYANKRDPVNIPSGEVWEVHYNPATSETYFGGRTLRVVSSREFENCVHNGVQSLLLMLPSTALFVLRRFMQSLISPIP